MEIWTRGPPFPLVSPDPGLTVYEKPFLASFVPQTAINKIRFVRVRDRSKQEVILNHDARLDTGRRELSACTCFSGILPGKQLMPTNEPGNRMKPRSHIHRNDLAAADIDQLMNNNDDHRQCHSRT